MLDLKKENMIPEENIVLLVKRLLGIAIFGQKSFLKIMIFSQHAIHTMAGFIIKMI